MAEFRVEHPFNCSEDTFWSKVMFEEDYNHRLYRERLKFHTWREIRREDTGDEIQRVIEAVPPIGDLPGPLKSLIGDNVSYQERGVFNRKTKQYHVEVIPSVLPDKVSVRIDMTTVPDGPDRCRRIAKGTITAKIFGVGGMLEKRMIADLEKSYAKSAEFTNLYVTEKGLR
jgi:hypothetical protein